MKEKFSFSIKQIIILLLLLLILVTLIIYALFFSNNKTINNDSRTIMIYLVGSNLESDLGIVTSDLKSIVPSKIDLDKTNILIYTGGTKKWHNFIQNDENAIYILKENGFKKVESYEMKNMGSPNTLSSFLNYCYEKYKAKNYNLIMYDHGNAIEGAIYDDFTGDNLDLLDLATAMNNSPFNEKNKLQTILFRTCLNGTTEIATIFSKYAEYMIASEEVTWGSAYSNVLSFLNDITPNDDGVEFGKKFISSYERQMKEINPIGNITVTYSIVDLSYISDVISEVNNFFNSINNSSNYSIIAKNRANSFQYGNDIKDSLDMIDLYDIVSNIKNLSSNDAEKLLNTLDKAIVYNKTNLGSSHGLSIYFPYKGDELSKDRYLSIYSRISSLSKYNDFINNFNKTKNNQESYNFNLSFNKVESNKKNEVTFKLNDEQMDVYSSSKLTVFRRNKEHPNYYSPLYTTNDIKLDSSGLLTARIDNNMIKIYDTGSSEDDGQYIPVIDNTNEFGKQKTVYSILYDNDSKFMDDSYSATSILYINEENGIPKFSTAILRSRNGRIDGMVLDLEKYEVIEVIVGNYIIQDENGKYTPEWESSPVIMGYDMDSKTVRLEKSGLDNEGEYYAVFTITDINDNKYYSDLIRMGE